MNELANYFEAKRIRQALKNNPNDVDSQIKLAAMVADLDLKRKLLNRTLSLDPTNLAAREMLLEIDRGEINSSHSQPLIQQTASVATSIPSAKDPTVLVSRYSIVPRILVYLLLALAVFFMVLAIPDWEVVAFFGACFLLFLIPTWFVSAVVEVDAAGIKLFRLFRIYQREVEWNEIESIKPAPLGQGIKLITTLGTSITISSQIGRHSAIVEILRKVRPGLFDFEGDGSSSGIKIFKKKFFAKYILLFFSIVLSLIFLGMIVTAQIVPGIFVGIFLFLLWRAALNGTHTVKLEGNKLSRKSFHAEQELTAQQIKNINMVTLRNTRGVARNLIEIELINNSKFTLAWFPEGNEIMYGFLRNWWNKYQNA